MRCEYCGRDGASELTIIQSGKKENVFMCRDCLFRLGEKQEEIVDEYFEIAGQFGMFGNPFAVSAYDVLFIDQKGSERVERGAVCGHCGTTDLEFYRTGFVGCPHCYQEMGLFMDNAIESSQRGTRHVGKRPKKYGVNPVSVEYKKLLAELESAMADRRFDDAKRLSMRLKELNGGNL